MMSAAAFMSRGMAQNSSPYELDKYGGWKGKKFKATGFFRAEKEDRWWLVTPEGNAFLSFGINHFYPYLWNQDYNRDAWCKKLGVEKAGSADFNKALKKWFLKTCREFGFNTVGCHNYLPLVNRPKSELAYIQPVKFVDIAHWKKDIPDENFVDVFSDDFIKHCDKLARKLAEPIKNDPFLLGYSMTDCALFTDEDCRERTDVIGGARRGARIGWVKRLRNFPAKAPGKQAYVELMKKLYRDKIVDFNETYSTEFGSFTELANAVDWRLFTHLHNGYELRDNIEFLKVVVEQYYKVAKGSIQKYDPNHMFVGDKLNGNTNSIDSVLPVTCKYTDVIFYQMYGRFEVQRPGLDRWMRLSDKPIINGDSAYTMVCDHMPRPYGPIADNLKQRAEWTDEFFTKAFARKNFVGWHYCGLIDATQQVSTKQARQHSGLMDGFGNPYPELQKVMKSRASEIYSLAQSGS